MPDKTENLISDTMYLYDIGAEKLQRPSDVQTSAR